MFYNAPGFRFKERKFSIMLLVSGLRGRKGSRMLLVSGLRRGKGLEFSWFQV